MDVENLKYVVGKAETDKPAIIRFFSSVDECSVQCFNDEFLWLQDYVKPSKIIVMINSEGGSVLYGMSTFSIIRSCPIEVDCVVEGIAASMASIIWAAGDNLFMHDYSLLMIHNPFNAKNIDNDPSLKQTVEAFRSQLETIYTKRFGLSKEKVAAIMNGEGEADGTFFSASDAVKAGFLPAENVIKTSKKVRDKVKCEMEGIVDTASIRDIMSAVSAEVDENKLLEDISAIRNRKDNSQIQDQNKMETNENVNFDAISAQLGLAKDTQAAAIEARIAELMKTEATLKETQSELTAVKIKLEGKEAELANVNSELSEVKDALKAYKDAEQAAREAEIASVIEDAIKAGKIEASAKDAWVTMANADFATVKATLASIQAREVITATIASDPANVATVEKTLEDVDAQVKAAIKEKLGDVQFDKF
jgi:ATP-dependent protease ClpP protease subunit